MKPRIDFLTGLLVVLSVLWISFALYADAQAQQWWMTYSVKYQDTYHVYGIYQTKRMPAISGPYASQRACESAMRVVANRVVASVNHECSPEGKN